MKNKVINFSAIIIAFFVLSTIVAPLSAQENSSMESDSTVIKTIFDTELTEGLSYEHLRQLCKKVGPRLSGSEGADRAVEWGQKLLSKIADTVWLQPVMVPHWVRGEEEYAEIRLSDGEVIPVPITALGSSIGTGKDGITAEVIEVTELKDLEKLGEEVLKDKIVLYNRPMEPTLLNTFTAYSGCVDQRSSGAKTAAPFGALAVLVRSMNLRNDDLPHTGVQRYAKDIKKIPAAAISTNGARLLSKKLRTDSKLKVHIKMSCKNLPDKLSYNVVADIRGSVYPDEIILVGGHLDSWDLGEGAHDDGAGTVHSIEVLYLMKKLGIQPKHTLRCVLYMNEENGPNGAIEYAKVSKEKKWKHAVAIESDRGGFTPRGFSFDGTDKVQQNCLKQVEKWQDLLNPYGLHHFDKGFGGVDIGLLKDQDVPLIGFVPDSQRYFDHHHAANDVFEEVNKRELELGSASIAALVYLLDKYGLKTLPAN